MIMHSVPWRCNVNDIFFPNTICRLNTHPEIKNQFPTDLGAIVQPGIHTLVSCHAVTCYRGGFIHRLSSHSRHVLSLWRESMGLRPWGGGKHRKTQIYPRWCVSHVLTIGLHFMKKELSVRTTTPTRLFWLWLTSGMTRDTFRLRFFWVMSIYDEIVCVCVCVCWGCLARVRDRVYKLIRLRSRYSVWKKKKNQVIFIA